jgi:hypothetical protein
LPRHRIITWKRNKLIIVTAAGALTLATAASAAAAAWPSGSAASPAGTAFSAITAPSGETAATGGSWHYLAAQKVRATADQQALTMLAYQRAAAHRAAVRQVAKRKAQAELAAKQVAARQAQQSDQQAAQPSAQPSAGQQAPAQQTASQQTASQQAPSSAAPAPSGSAQSIAEAMLGSFGWSSSQSSCLQPLWAGESSWSVTASNPSTGAYGIPQALPGSKMASAGPDWQTSAATQIRWGLGYIKNTYGSPCAAWSHEQSDGWY